jgi:basic membrane protein A
LSRARTLFSGRRLTGLGAINAAKEKGVLAIGVDVDQNNVAPDTVLTSAFKELPTSVYATIKSAMDGKFQGGTNITLASMITRPVSLHSTPSIPSFRRL